MRILAIAGGTYLQGYVKEKQRIYCWETPDFLQAAQVSTSVGQTAQDSRRPSRAT